MLQKPIYKPMWGKKPREAKGILDLVLTVYEGIY